jgi:long-chain acyl-CoA synthetase
MKYQFKDSGATAIVIIDLFLNNLEEIIKDTNIKTVISTSYWDYLPAWKAPIVKIGMKLKKMIPSHNLKTICFKEAVAKGAAKPVSPVEIGHQDIAVLQYTGGTTGVSKGAVLTNSNILANMLQIQNIAKVQVKEGHECVLTALPLYHIFALTVNFLSFLAMGQRMILVPLPIPLSNVVKAFKKYPITVMTGINTLFNGLNNNSDFKANPPRSLRIALAGGMALQEAVNKQWQQLTGMPIIEGFGLTESSPVTHVNPLDGHMRIGSIGIPVASTDAKCVGPDGKEVPNGQPGELIIKGPQVMKEYWNQPEDTAKTIKNGWLWTGDIAIRDEDGFFKIVDRKKDMILVSGFNVFPNEVEGVLMLHAKVLEAAVIGIPDKTSGEAVKALVVPKDKSLTVDEIKQHCHDQLTGYKRPRHIEFRESLPKSNVGKILRRELRDEELARKQK